MISTIVLPPGAIEATRERFRIPGVFSRPCPHAIAARLQQVSEANAAGDRAKAIELMRDVCRDAPEEPRFRLRLADLLSGGDSEQRAQGFALWMALAFDGKRVTTSVRARVYETLVAYAVAHGDEREARRLVDEGVTLQLDDNERRQLEALRFALHHRGPAGPALRGYFFHDGGPLPSHASWAMLAALAEPSLGFAHYLVGLQHYNTGELAASAMRLDRALALGVPGIAFVKNGARRLAVAAYRAGDAIRIQTAITILSRADMSTVEKLLAKDWFDRIAFDAMDYVYIPDKNSQR